jgi:hypothetical protein
MQANQGKILATSQDTILLRRRFREICLRPHDMDDIQRKSTN